MIDIASNLDIIGSDLPQESDSPLDTAIVIEFTPLPGAIEDDCEYIQRKGIIFSRLDIAAIQQSSIERNNWLLERPNFNQAEAQELGNANNILDQEEIPELSDERQSMSNICLYVSGGMLGVVGLACTSMAVYMFLA